MKQNNVAGMRRDAGASSVLVLLVLLLLVFLAVLSFVTTGSSLRLARKNADTVRAWYQMDMEGERTAAKLLQTVHLAGEEATAWLDGNRFLDNGQTLLPEDVVIRIRQHWQTLRSESERQAFRNLLHGRIHMLLSGEVAARMQLDGVEIVGADPEAVFADLNAPLDVDSAGTQFVVRVQDVGHRLSGTLVVVLEVLPAASAKETGYLRVLQWKLDQPPFTYENQIQLWEGIVE